MRLNEIVEKYSQFAPDLARWMESAIPEGLTIFAFPDLGMHLTQPTPTHCIFSPQLDEFYYNMLWRLNEVLTQIS